MMHFLIKNVLIHIYFKNSNLTVGLNQIKKFLFHFVDTSTFITPAI